MSGKMLGVTCQTLSSLVNAKAFGSVPRAWLGMQLDLDLYKSRDLKQKIRVKAFPFRGQDRTKNFKAESAISPFHPVCLSPPVLLFSRKAASRRK